MERAAKYRKWRSQDEVLGLVRDWERSGLSQRVFCQRRGLALSTFTLYCRRARAASEAPAPAAVPKPKLLPVQVVGGAALVVVHPTGLRIEVGGGFDGQALRQLLEALER